MSKKNIDIIWKETLKIFPFLDNSVEFLKLPNSHNQYVTEEEFKSTITNLIELDIIENVYESIFLSIGYILRKDVIPEFWSYFRKSNNLIDDSSNKTVNDSNNENDQSNEDRIVDDKHEIGFQKFKIAIYKLEKNYQKIKMYISKLQIIKKMFKFKKKENLNKNELQLFDMMLKSHLLSELPANFNDIVYSFYNISFKIFANSHQNDEHDDSLEDIDDMKCNGCGKDTENCRCQELITVFNETNQYLTNMNLLDRLAGYTLTNLIQERIANHVQNTCKGIFDTSHLGNLEKWLDSIVLNWLTRIYNRGTLKIDDNDQKIRYLIQDFKVKLSYYLHETYANVIIEQFFNIIIDFPDSQPAIDDLKICLEKLDLRQHLIETVKKSLELRLLHPGANTMDILTGYVAAIKAIRHVDSSGVLLETITEPIKEYLRKRNDTVRQVVTGLTEEGPTDLAEELARGESLKENVDIMMNAVNGGKDDMTDWENWNPDPIDANSSSRTTRNSRSADIISMIVDIYGSKELFVNEYKSLLAERLLSQLDFNPEKEIRNLELLKLRFGDNLLHNCEVMLKDISDSKRISTHIQSDINYSNTKKFDISSLIISSQFWPAFNKETLELPSEINNEFKKYTISYEAYKGNRTLYWRHVTGRVTIEIELANKTLEMTVTPTQAIIIYHFQNKNQWTLEELSQLMKVPPSILRKRIMFWQTHGIIKEKETDIYVLIEEQIERSNIEEVHAPEICEDDESESVMASASDQREEELQVFWSYIVGMLTNLDSLPLERIHQMLRMFASHGPGIEFSQEELKNFLQRKVREQKLTLSGGVYQLPK